MSAQTTTPGFPNGRPGGQSAFRPGAQFAGQSGGQRQQQADAYLRTRVLSATPEELRLLLIDGALKFARQAQAGLEARDHELAYAGFSQCRDIISEFIRTAANARSEIAENVQAIYTFMYRELVEASMEKDADRVGKVIELLEYDRETWVQFMERLRTERGGTATPAAAAPAAPAAAPARPTAPPAVAGNIRPPAPRPMPTQAAATYGPPRPSISFSA